jgi:glycerophosphoryl diester phosphodiesterase
VIIASSTAPLIGAHRGASREAPENTVAAFDLAIEQGAELIELDVHLSRDGRLVVHHDFDLQRTAGCAARIGDLDWEDLRKLDVGSWLHPRFGHERLQTLDAVLERYGTRLLLNVEIKVDKDPHPGIEDLVAQAIAEHSLADRVVVSTFDVETFLRLRRRNPNVRASLLFEVPSLRAGGLSAQDHLDAAFVIASHFGAVGLHLDHSLINRNVMDRAAYLNLGVLAWTVDDEQQMSRLARLGVEVILSNSPQTLRRQILPLRSATGT